MTSLVEIQRLLRDGSLTMVDLVNSYLSKIEASRDLNIYIEVFEEEILEKAHLLDKKIQNKEHLGKLFGAVISIKDVICYKDHSVTAGSKILGGFTSQFTATGLQRLIDEDALIIGRTNCDEFAMGSTNEHSFYGPTKNGIDPLRVPGGSSGAAAVSVEQGTCTIALGSDTGGSVRQPAAFCGVFGMKPTYGRISRYGLIAYGSSFDQIGILANNVYDISIALHVMSGADSFDATTAPVKPPAIVQENNQPLRIAYFPAVLEHEGLNDEIKENFIENISYLESLGHTCIPKTFELLDYLVPTYYVLTTAEASSNLSRYDGIKYGYQDKDAADLEELYANTRSEGFGTEVKRRIMMGTFVLSVGYFDAYFTKAQKVRTMIIEQLRVIFEDCDMIMLPTTTDIAWKRGELMNDPVSMYLSDIFTVLANLGGLPAISIPQTHKNLEMPFGVQFLADKYQEDPLLSLSLTFCRD